MTRQWKSKVGFHIIVRDEGGTNGHLDRCLTSMKGCWDEGYLCITDTGSVDDTVEIAKKHGSIVDTFEWIYHFGKARQFSLEKLYEHCPDVDWCCFVDADDVLANPESVIRFREMLDQYLDDPNVECINLPYIYSHSAADGVSNQSIPEFKYHRLRAFKKGKGNWRQPIHEFIDSDPTKHVNRDDVVFDHFRNGTGEQNTKRNLDIFRRTIATAAPDELPRLLFYMGKEACYNQLYDEALDCFSKYLPLSNWIPEKHRAMYEMSVVYQIKGDIEKSKEMAFKAITLNPRYVDPYIQLALLAYNEKDWKMCYNWANIAGNLDAPEVHFFDFIPYNTFTKEDLKAVAAWNLGDFENGKKAMDKCLFYRPYDRRFLFNWTQFYPTEKISIIIPTYNRPEQLKRCIKAIHENAIIQNYEVMVGVDGDYNYNRELSDFYKDDAKVRLFAFPKTGAINIVNHLVEVSDAKYVTYLGDDTVPLAGFLIHAYVDCADKNLVSYNDNVWNGEIAAHWFAPKELKDKLGGNFFHNGYRHVGCDNELTIKAKKAGIYKFSERARIDHIHYIKGNCSDKNKVAEMDECYQIGWDEDNVKADRELLARRIANNFLTNHEELNISVGAGDKKIDGFLTLDKFNVAADIIADVMEPGLFNDNTVDKFKLEHVLEHFTEPDANTLLKILYSALKPSGILGIDVPDISKIDQVTDKEYRTKVLYGWQQPGMYHRWGYSRESLVKLLEEHGFSILNVVEGWQYDAPSLHVTASKS